MKTRITRTLASLALATALLSGSSAAFAATPDLASPALYDLGALGDLGLPVDPGDLGSPGLPVDLGSLTDVGSHVGGGLEIANGAAGVVSPIVGSVESIPSHAASTGFGIASSAVQGAGLPGLPFPLP